MNMNSPQDPLSTKSAHESGEPDSNQIKSAPNERWIQWTIVILLSILVALSGAQLLGTVLFELVIDYKSALVRVVILLPVLIIASYLLVKKWHKLILNNDEPRNGSSSKE
jgi:hypothetical protein